MAATHREMAKVLSPVVVALALVAPGCGEEPGGRDDGGGPAPTTVTTTTGTGGATATTVDPTTTGGDDTSGEASSGVAGSSGEVGDTSEVDASTGIADECQRGSMDLSYVVSPDAPTMRIEMPLEPGKDYATLRLAVEYTVGPWREPCFNPATAQGSGFPAFESLLALKRGDHWCKGGALVELSLHGPGPGHGLDSSASASTYFREEPWDGPGCGETSVEGQMFAGAHGHDVGGMYRSEVTLDFVEGVADAVIGDAVIGGGIPEGVFLRGPESDPYAIVLSWDGPELECYGDDGVEQEGAPCCFGPSAGWSFSRVEWEAC